MAPHWHSPAPCTSAQVAPTLVWKAAGNQDAPRARRPTEQRERSESEPVTAMLAKQLCAMACFARVCNTTHSPQQSLTMPLHVASITMWTPDPHMQRFMLKHYQERA